MKYKLIIIAMVISLITVGAAYGEWSQVITVISRISTGSLTGDVVYDSNEADVIVTEEEFHDYYQVRVDRSDLPSSMMNDTITFKNQGTIPAQMQNFQAGDVSISAIVKVTTEIQPEALPEEGSEEGGEPIVPEYEENTIEIVLPAHALEFYVDGVLVQDLSALCAKLEVLNTIIEPDSEQSISLVEVLNRNAVEEVLALTDSQSLEIISSRWSYSYQCELITFNAN